MINKERYVCKKRFCLLGKSSRSWTRNSSKKWAKKARNNKVYKGFSIKEYSKREVEVNGAQVSRSAKEMS